MEQFTMKKSKAVFNLLKLKIHYWVYSSLKASKDGMILWYDKLLNIIQPFRHMHVCLSFIEHIYINQLHIYVRSESIQSCVDLNVCVYVKCMYLSVNCMFVCTCKLIASIVITKLSKQLHWWVRERKRGERLRDIYCNTTSIPTHFEDITSKMNKIISLNLGVMKIEIIIIKKYAIS